MDVRKKILLVGIGVVILSAAVATQYARITIGYEFSVVHPSDGLIRFVALDNATDGHRLLRVIDNGTGEMKLKFGNISQGMVKTYTAAFAIVNEEGFKVNITGISFTGTGQQYVRVWLHSHANTEASSDGGLQIWDGSNSQGWWILDAGNGDNTTMESTSTPWDSDDHIRYAADTPVAINGSTDFVWVQISIDASSSATKGDYSGTLEFTFKAEE